MTGKSRDDLQAAMALVRGSNMGQPFQFKNFRD
ncbi:putative nucleotide-binding protein [Salmonella enterica subsp. enterica serovar Berta str. ATCC 8392]|nr:putative nucleotide-binding protein [Salmonella enterica subsp. enterica serovar Berta str. ATCC 8392]